MSPDRPRNRESFPTRASIKSLVREITGNMPPTPEQIILERISGRVTKGADEADAMRVELYLIDVINAASRGGRKKDEELLEDIKQSRGYQTLDTNMVISDETTLFFLNEAREGLKELRQQK